MYIYMGVCLFHSFYAYAHTTFFFFLTLQVKLKCSINVIRLQLKFITVRIIISGNIMRFFLARFCMLYAALVQLQMQHTGGKAS